MKNCIILSFCEEHITAVPGSVIKYWNVYRLLCKNGFIEIKPDHSVTKVLKSYVSDSSDWAQRTKKSSPSPTISH
ncbi:hypothetical protein [Solitalea koreensis]|uniref:Uncharacterized protein n=1 Tax=Solitalea koreensis TaxID=543615 RepID=A0A521ARZ6_9SPHI|nr:hypothetical protein [Solitalea koreensis]SMO37598.1 hypothetical protein SAMN06265350_101355 [Solitalea koreensis]